MHLQRKESHKELSEMTESLDSFQLEMSKTVQMSQVWEEEAERFWILKTLDNLKTSVFHRKLRYLNIKICKQRSTLALITHTTWPMGERWRIRNWGRMGATLS